jgi:hypothetical protein
VILPRIVDQIRLDLEPSLLNSLTDFDYGVWQTPEGTAFVDGETLNVTPSYLELISVLVLASNKDVSNVVKGKDAQMAKWDDEVRKSLASKKGNAPALTKQQQALVRAQLEKERQVRERVIGINAQVDRGLALVKSVVNASVEELPPYIAPITKLMLDGVLKNGKALVGQEAFNIYLVSSPYPS